MAIIVKIKDAYQQLCWRLARALQPGFMHSEPPPQGRRASTQTFGRKVK